MVSILNKITLLVLFSLFIFVLPSVYAQDVYVYVAPLEGWEDYASNVMYLSTSSWENANDDLHFYKVENPSDSDLRIQWVKEFGVSHIGYAYGQEFIEVSVGDSHCGTKWHPYSEKYIAHIMSHEMGHFFGLPHSNDPTSLMYHTALYTEYGKVEEDYRLTEGYFQFVKLCTDKDLTSYEFNISTSDENHGFDYYIVPSSDEFVKLGEGKEFQHYSNDDCFGEGWLSISGTCEGVSKNAGIIVIMDNTLTTPLETITVKQTEKPYITNSKSPFDTKLFTPRVDDTIVLDSTTQTLIKNEVGDLKEKITSLESSISKLKRINQQHVKNSKVDDKRMENLQKQIQELKVNKKIYKKEIATFVDKTKDPQSYIDRYNNEPKYKKWFDENYQEYSSIYEAVGKNQPLPNWIKNNAGWWAEGKISEKEFVKGIEYLIEQGIINTN